MILLRFCFYTKHINNFDKGYAKILSKNVIKIVDKNG